LCHMKTISIRELHARTGELVRQAARHGEIRVTDSGRVVAKIVPETERAEVPYFARRRYVSSRIKKLIETGLLGGGGTDSTVAISEDREDRV
jgi:prevent-host-death family protein